MAAGVMPWCTAIDSDVSLCLMEPMVENMAAVTDKNPINTAWQALNTYAKKMHAQQLVDLFAQDPQRVEQFSLQVDGLYLDYSKNLIDQQGIKLLAQWADSMQLSQQVQRLFDADIVNQSEHKPALHWALRWPERAPADCRQTIADAWRQSCDLAQQIRQQQWKGCQGQAITDILHIGIGGSELGPVLLQQALSPYQDYAIRVHYLASHDPLARVQLLRTLPAATTLVVLASKSFSSHEFLDNQAAVQAWLVQATGIKTAWAEQSLAITARPEAAVQLGVQKQHILPVWEWLGGRYSIGSAISFASLVQLGPDKFQEFLHGAAAMDQHFLDAPLQQNMPMLMAALALWYHQFFTAPSQAVLVYSQRLAGFPAYLQQLCMESLGKDVNQHGQSVGYATGMVTWGGIGPQSQHSFHQLLMQGSHLIPVDLIAVASDDEQLMTLTEHVNINYTQLNANAIAQAHTLMCGYQVGSEDVLASSKSIRGNRPSNFLLLPRLNPYHLGQLIALYEHRVYCESVMLNINAFDQWGVARSKQVATELLEQCGQDPSSSAASSAALASDPSSQDLWRRIIDYKI